MLRPSRLAALAAFLLASFPPSPPLHAQQSWGEWTLSTASFGDWRWAGPVADEASLPAGSAPGTCRWATAEAAIYCWTGAAWVEASGGGVDDDVPEAGDFGGTPSTATFLRGDMAWSNTLTGALTLGGGATGLRVLDGEIEQQSGSLDIHTNGTANLSIYGLSGDNIQIGSGSGENIYIGGNSTQPVIGTGEFNFTASKLRVPNGNTASLPATCLVGQQYVNTQTGFHCDCTATNTWTCGAADTAVTAATANAGDSATAFFSAGTIEAARLPAVTALASACTDAQVLGGTAAGTGVECQADATGTDDQVASEVPFTPAGTIAATDVQAAIEEVASEAGGGGTPGGSDTQVQYNDGGAFGGDADFTFTETGNVVSLASGQLNVDNLRLDGNTLSTTNANGDLTLAPNGTGSVVPPSGSAASPGIELEAGGTGLFSRADGYVMFASNGSEYGYVGPGLVGMSINGGVLIHGGPTNSAGARAGIGSVTTDVLKVLDSSANTGHLLAKRMIAEPHAVDCTDSGNGSPGALTLTPTSSRVHLTNLDADGCTVTMGETGMTSGFSVEVIVVSNAGGTVTWADSSGVQEVPAGGLALALYDAASFGYISDRFVALSTSDN